VLHCAQAPSACLHISPPSLTTRRRVLCALRGVVHGHYSSAAFFTAPSHSSTAILPLYGTRAPLTDYHSSPPGRSWPPVMPCFRCFRSMFLGVSSGCSICCNGYIYACCKNMFQVFQTYVLSACCISISGCCITCTCKCMFRVFHTYVASVFKVDLDVACICNDFQVFLGVLQVFQLFRMYVTSVLSRCYKSKYGVTHAAIGPPATTTCCNCWGHPKRAQMVPACMRVGSEGGTSCLRVLSVRRAACAARVAQETGCWHECLSERPGVSNPPKSTTYNNIREQQNKTSMITSTKSQTPTLFMHQCFFFKKRPIQSFLTLLLHFRCLYFKIISDNTPIQPNSTHKLIVTLVIC
jgi:hypothetical protein